LIKEHVVQSMVWLHKHHVPSTRSTHANVPAMPSPPLQSCMMVRRCRCVGPVGPTSRARSPSYPEDSTAAPAWYSNRSIQIVHAHLPHSCPSPNPPSLIPHSPPLALALAGVRVRLPRAVASACPCGRERAGAGRGPQPPRWARTNTGGARAPGTATAAQVCQGLWPGEKKGDGTCQALPEKGWRIRRWAGAYT
jgi:hypothetical protein